MAVLRLIEYLSNRTYPQLNQPYKKLHVEYHITSQQQRHCTEHRLWEDHRDHKYIPCKLTYLTHVYGVSMDAIIPSRFSISVEADHFQLFLWITINHVYFRVILQLHDERSVFCCPPVARIFWVSRVETTKLHSHSATHHLM
ncbi:hypothetical protein CRM22_005536 [Opisthorchis felineus]|uniref:Uncharacterized protein n=1 Tax=Opisthorchis felineus TaxID=147828 RepID=A0A4S2LXX2_OPIFE|nr:hypothetical protein CRM22_005536 [Opisthorchis felineus]